MTDQTTTIPKGWRMTILGEVVNVLSGSTPSTKEAFYWDGNIPWITPKDLSGYSSVYISKGERNITKEGLKNSSAHKLPRNTILFSSRAPIGYVVIAKNEVTTNQGFKNIICDEINSHFLFFYYWLIYNASYIEKFSSGSTFSEVSASVLRSLAINLPSLAEQRAIAAVLSSLDNKIELLREQNKTLEATAQAIFKEWFVNFNFPGATGKMIDSRLGEIPEGWSVIKLRDLITENRRGISPIYAEKGIPVINQRCVRNGTVIEEAIQFHDNSTQEAPDWAYLRPKDILINSMGVGTLGRIAQIFIDRESSYLVHSCITILRANKEIIDPIILGYKIKSLETKIESMGTGTTGQTSLNNNLLGELEIIVPEKNIQTKLAPTLDSITTKIDSNFLQIETLSVLRNSLLPKLTKGEIRVNDFND